MNRINKKILEIFNLLASFLCLNLKNSANFSIVLDLYPMRKTQLLTTKIFTGKNHHYHISEDRRRLNS